MDRRLFLQGGAVAALSVALPAAAQPAGEDAKLRNLLDAFWDELIDVSPEGATALGLDMGPRAHLRSELSDYSPAGRVAMFDRLKGQLARLKTVDRAKLSASAQVDYDVVSYEYARKVEGGERFRFGEGLGGGYTPYSPYSLSQLSGAYQSVPDFLDSNHPVKTAADGEAYLARLQAFATALDASTEAFRADAGVGVLAPDFLLDATRVQLGKLAASDDLSASLVRKAGEAHIAGDWKPRADAIVAQAVRPAIQRQIGAIDALRAKATHDAGIWKIPNGAAYYAAALAFHTTTDLKPDEVHRQGLEQVKDLTARIDVLLRAQGLTSGTVSQRLIALNTRPDQLYPNTDAGRAEVLAYLNGRIADIRTRLPRAFATLPKAPMEIVRVPPAIEDGAANGYATDPSLDGTRPGRFYINLKDTAEWPKYSLPTLAYHEGYPGHQWEGAISNENKGGPLLRSRAMNFAAYGEGWALYAEQLADELGVYDNDPLGKIGYLQSLLFRAVRLVTDTGLHSKQWSREKATDYMVEAIGRPRGGMQREVDRYCVWPGQACSYKVGHNEWVRLRDEARVRQGARFDIKQFHEVLRGGSMPLVVLQQVVKTTLV